MRRPAWARPRMVRGGGEGAGWPLTSVSWGEAAGAVTSVSRRMMVDMVVPGAYIRQSPGSVQGVQRLHAAVQCASDKVAYYH